MSDPDEGGSAGPAGGSAEPTGQVPPASETPSSPSPPPPPPPSTPQSALPTERSATNALICGVVSLVLSLLIPILGIILGIITLVLAPKAEQRIRDSNGALGGEGQVRSAKIIAIVAIAVAVVNFIVAIVLYANR